MRTPLITALRLYLVLTLLAGVGYPLGVTALAQLLCPRQANGSLLRQDGAVRGSTLLGQEFTAPGDCWGRLSATDPPYNAAASAGSNLGPLNPALQQRVTERVAALHAADPTQSAPIPIDLVTASASGLDPHISPAAAAWQAPRIARARHLPEAQVAALIAQCTQSAFLGGFGPARVNVVQLNQALDAASRDAR